MSKSASADPRRNLMPETILSSPNEVVILHWFSFTTDITIPDITNTFSRSLILSFHCMLSMLHVVT